ncbi:MAG: hypothetical protein APF76_17750 [Desulfitibacter sp. BRH_c19]|nr:MAG: hypothetical protein APF76_17750 [Desulfitibacter sp. BRH_c19]
MEAKRQSSFFSFLDKFEDYSVTILYATMVIVIFLQVFFRFVIKASLPWSEELARYIMAYAVFIGAAIAAKEGAHIGINVIVGALPKPFDKYMRGIAMFISFIFAALLLYLSIIIVMFLMKTGQKSPAMLIPIWIAYLSVPLGAILMSIRFLQSTYLNFKEERG